MSIFDPPGDISAPRKRQEFNIECEKRRWGVEEKETVTTTKQKAPSPKVLSQTNAVPVVVKDFKKYVERKFIPEFRMTEGDHSYLDRAYWWNVSFASEAEAKKFGMKRDLGDICMNHRWAEEPELKKEAKKHFLSKMGVKEWRTYREHVFKKYQETDSFVLDQSIENLASEEMQKILSPAEIKKLRSLYVSKYKADPKGLQLKKDLLALDMYIRYKEKEAQPNRSTLKKRLEKLVEEYNSDEIRTTLLSESRRLKLRGALHKKLKKELIK